MCSNVITVEAVVEVVVAHLRQVVNLRLAVLGAASCLAGMLLRNQTWRDRVRHVT